VGEVRDLAGEQAAVRRVAALVARPSSPSAALAGIAEELGTSLRVAGVAIVRREADASVTVLAGWGAGGVAGLVGRRLPAPGVTAALGRALGAARPVTAPVVVGGARWGDVVAGAPGPAPRPAETAARVRRLTELVAPAIGALVARAELAASRARIVRAGDETRRRFERDLHDGVQGRLVSLSLELRGVEAALDGDPDAARARLADARAGLEAALDDLRELAHGLHPAILSQVGLAPALRALARRAAVPVRLEVDDAVAASEAAQVAAYHVVGEAVTNAAKHARASLVEVRVAVRAGVLGLEVRDDGAGGADPGAGTGLAGLGDRVAALGGTLAISSPAGGGTRLTVRLPADAA
jgi:signal transduction histidine kinase